MWSMFVLGAVAGATIAFIVRGRLSAWNEYDLDVRHGRLIRFTVQAIAVLDAYHNDRRAVQLVEYGRQLLKMED
jgi:hypothetical protein